MVQFEYFLVFSMIGKQGWLWEAWPFPSHLLLESGRRWCHAREIAQRERNVLGLTWWCDNW